MLPVNEVLHSPPLAFTKYNSPLLGEVLTNNENLAGKFESKSNQWDHHFNQSFNWQNEPLIQNQSPTIGNSFNKIDWTNCTFTDPKPEKSIWINTNTRNNPIIQNYSRFYNFSNLPESNLYERYVQDTYGKRNYNYYNWLNSVSTEEN